MASHTATTTNRQRIPNPTVLCRRFGCSTARLVTTATNRVLRNPSKMDELTSLASAAMDQAQRILNVDLIAGENISGMSADKSRPDQDRAPVTVDRERQIVTAGSGANIERYAWMGETLNIDN